jgi:uncharacterized protein (DUF433 family)
LTLRAPFDRIAIEPGKLGGKPCIRGLRIPVENVLRILASYRDRQELCENYPDLEKENLLQALAFAAANLDDRVEIPDLVPGSPDPIRQCRGRRLSSSNWHIRSSPIRPHRVPARTLR